MLIMTVNNQGNAVRRYVDLNELFLEVLSLSKNTETDAEKGKYALYQLFQEYPHIIEIVGESYKREIIQEKGYKFL